MSNKRITILGCPVDNLSKSQTLDLVESMVRSGKTHQHVVINVDKLLKARRDRQLLDIISQCDIINADGMPIVWLSRLLKNPIAERVTGIDLMESLIKRSAEKGYRVYFLGARKEVLERVVEKYRERYPSLRMAGFHDGYWDSREEWNIVEDIRQAHADILFVAISSPQKELFVKRHLARLNVSFVMGVGGSFDVVAGYVKRAPCWMQNAGLEWFYRFVQEPRRLWRRYLIGNIIFMFLAAKELIRRPKHPA